VPVAVAVASAQALLTASVLVVMVDQALLFLNTLQLTQLQSELD
jgi:hypothetical protein